MKTLSAVFLTCLLLMGAVFSHAEALSLAGESWESVEVSSGLDSSAALEGYIDRAFGLRTEITKRDARLSGLNLKIYNLLKPLVQQVAAGELGSTVFEIDVGSDAEGLVYGLDQLKKANPDLVSIRTETGDIAAGVMDAYFILAGFDIRAVVNALIANLSYDLYWFNKTYSYKRYVYSNGKVSVFQNQKMIISLHVAPEFSADQADHSTSFNTDLAASISAAAETARGIAAQHAEEGDAQKLRSFKDAICELTSYNYDAIRQGFPYGNPWQLIWVFDGDPETKVVCEGYAKAFKYLCELSAFQASVSVSLVTGTLGSSNHMWNLVSVDGGFSYLVDVTNCDEGMAGYPDYLFMAGYSERYQSGGNTGYIFNFKDDSHSLTYVYDSTTVNLYSADQIAVSDRNYSVENVPAVENTGACGSQLTWTLYEDGLLIITGTGAMDDLPETEKPWTSEQTSVCKVLIQDGVTSIGEKAFSQCESLTEVYLPNSLTKIGASAFIGCTKLQSIRLPAGVSSIGDYAFSDCEKLSAFQLAPDSPAFSVSEDGVLFTRDRKTLVCYPAGKTVSSYQVPFATVEIGVGAFRGCANLSEVLIPDSVTKINDTAFLFCSGLTEVILPNHLQRLNYMAFAGCDGLARLSVPLALTHVEPYVFYGCKSLTDIHYAGTAEQWNAVQTEEGNDPLLTAEKHYLPVCVNFVLPTSLTAIEEEAFAGLPAGTVVQMPENVASIGDGAFGEGVLLVTDAGSYAAGWANKNGVRWVEPPDQN